MCFRLRLVVEWLFRLTLSGRCFESFQIRKEVYEFYDEFRDFFDKKKMLFITVTSKDLSNFINRYDQIFEICCLETISAHKTCSCTIF